MGILATIRSRQQRATYSPKHPRDPALVTYFGGGETRSGVEVTETTAMNFSAFYASVRVISETKASLPLQMFERTSNGRQRVTSHPVAELLKTQPNEDQTPMTWNEVRQVHVLTWGNSYTEIVYDNMGTPIRLIPRRPERVRPYRSDAGDLRYEIQPERPGPTYHLDRSEVVHVPGLSLDGIVGKSVVRLAAESIGIGLANEKFAATFFGNSARPSIIVTHPGEMSDKAYKRLKEDTESRTNGENAHKPLFWKRM